MRFISGTEDFKLDNTIVMIGKFDGMHRGHRKLLSKAVSLKTDDLELVIFSFDKNPVEFIKSHEIKKIVTRAELRRLELKTSVDTVIEYPFTGRLRNMDAEEFAREILKGKLGAKIVVCGEDFKFGRDRLGDAQILASLGEKYGFDVHPIEKLNYKDRGISSTYIKECIKEGNIADAREMLGRPYAITGVIDHGRGQGSNLGFPTANIRVPENKITPPYGVYATKMLFDGELHPGVSNLGIAPTFHDENGACMLETNLFDVCGDLYGKTATVYFYEFIRPERTFENVAELKAEVEKNIEQARAVFSE